MTVFETVREYNLRGKKARFYNVCGNELKCTMDNFLTFVELEVKSIYINLKLNTVDITVIWYESEVK